MLGAPDSLENHVVRGVVRHVVIATSRETFHQIEA
jgi:hypothetical protein